MTTGVERGFTGIARRRQPASSFGRRRRASIERTPSFRHLPTCCACASCCQQSVSMAPYVSLLRARNGKMMAYPAVSPNPVAARSPRQKSGSLRTPNDQRRNRQRQLLRPDATPVTIERIELHDGVVEFFTRHCKRIRSSNASRRSSTNRTDQRPGPRRPDADTRRIYHQACAVTGRFHRWFDRTLHP